VTPPQQQRTALVTHIGLSAAVAALPRLRIEDSTMSSDVGGAVQCGGVVVVIVDFGCCLLRVHRGSQLSWLLRSFILSSVCLFL